MKTNKKKLRISHLTAACHTHLNELGLQNQVTLLFFSREEVSIVIAERILQTLLEIADAALDLQVSVSGMEWKIGPKLKVGQTWVVEQKMSLA